MTITIQRKFKNREGFIAGCVLNMQIVVLFYYQVKKTMFRLTKNAVFLSF